LYKKYLAKGDIYVHANTEGAGSIIVKNPSNQPVPQRTLNEAGIFCVCRSKAWPMQVLITAYWVYDH